MSQYPTIARLSLFTDRPAEPHSYPKTHEYLVYSTSDEPPPAVTAAVETIVALFPRISIHGLLTVIQSGVCSALNGSQFQAPEEYQSHDRTSTEYSSDAYENFSHSDAGEFTGFDEEDDDFSPVGKPTPFSLRQKIRRDLRATKENGFKIGYLGNSAGGIVISVASRLHRLRIPEEVMDLWRVRPDDYFVLLLRYPHVYLGMNDLFEMGDSNFSFVQMRLGLCDSYKPSATAAVMAFQGNTPTEKDNSGAQETGKNNLRPLFIGAQLNKLLNERFMGIVRLRLKYGFSWTGAEHFFHVSQGKYLSDDDASSKEYLVPDEWGTPPPPMLMIDHMVDEGRTLSRMSFPLLAMQFSLRHFVRCTEFCLVCFCKKYDDFEALKPYVCSKGLCLYQYITYGMGPSLEHEIKSQPCVVDMLVSLAYARAKAGKLNDFPTGLGILIPDTQVTGQEHTRGDTSADAWVTAYHSATLDPKTLLLSHTGKPRIAKGHWILIVFSDGNTDLGSEHPWHCQVQNISESSNHAEISLPLRGSKKMSKEDVQSATKDWGGPRRVKYTIYETSFDKLTPDRKRRSIVMLLSTLPGIDQMINYLASQGPEGVLSSWWERIQPAALDLLRWIVASNRSCIVQDNSNPEHLVSGMQGYVQFRLVQGAPDKEQRFIRAVNENAMKAKPNYPTLFAWHGSAIHNWHSILREGLHFEYVANGRASGDGVYMAPQFETSLGYSDRGVYAEDLWPQSTLNMTSVISLNEVVNAPHRFECSEPNYVVAHLDWIQPRYLFVGTGKGRDMGYNAVSWNPAESKKERTASASAIYAQDPLHKVYGPGWKVSKIPISAISPKRRKELSIPVHTPEKCTKKIVKEISKHVSFSSRNTDDSGDIDSEATDIEDLKILFSDSDVEMDGAPPKKPDTKKRAAKNTTPKKTDNGKKAAPAIDFVPGTLKEGALPVLAPPQYATTFATKVLQKQFKSIVNIQKKEKLHELGWYVDPNLISGNLYQWIVELHSFEPELALAKDLKAAKLKSVILELRFPPNYPMDPPFVRVIRPRFLEFHAGGGGHVTLGGALCMELLTNSGWTAVTCIESLLLQVRLAITSTDPRPARLSPRQGNSRDYAVGEAVESYKRACVMHGWKIPKDVELMRW